MEDKQYLHLSLCICPEICRTCVFCVCGVMMMRRGNNSGNTVPDQLQVSRTGSQAPENRKRRCRCGKTLLPAIPPFRWASFRFVLIMVEKTAATRRTNKN